MGLGLFVINKLIIFLLCCQIVLNSFFYYSCCTYEICVRHSSIHIPHIFLSLAHQVGRCGSESLRLTFINRNVFFLPAGACILQMQNAVVFELCVSPAALCAAAVV